jgi:hypothetical protein
MGGLEAYNMLAEQVFGQPVRQFAAQPALAFRRVEMFQTMQGVSRERRGTLTGNDKDEFRSFPALPCDEMGKPHASGFKGIAVQVEVCIGLYLPPAKFLCCSPVKGLQRRNGGRGDTWRAAQGGVIGVSHRRPGANAFRQRTMGSRGYPGSRRLCA